METATLAEVIKSHIDLKGSFAIISAEKHTISQTENDYRSQLLDSELDRIGMRHFPCTGYYQEHTDNQPVKERSFFIMCIPADMDFMQDLCKYFQQECVLFSTGENIGFLTPGSFTPKYTSVSFNPTNAKAWTEIDGLKFSFE